MEKETIEEIYQIFDTDYSLDSTVEYNWTEFQDDRRGIIALTVKPNYHRN